MENLQSAEEYLAHHYEIPETFPPLPLADEDFVSQWQEGHGAEVLRFLEKNFELPAENFSWENLPALKIEFHQTLGGRLPVIKTATHDDFCSMIAVLGGKVEAKKYPLTVNAFTIPCRAEKIYRHRVILLNDAPYSNVPAQKLNLADEEWLKKSYLIRLRHESAHYETLRLFGGMKNHALDEILADTFGQIYAFGDFSPDRQRLFFGLNKDSDTCTGRLQFYCQKLSPNDLPKVFRAVNLFLEKISVPIAAFAGEKQGDLELLKFLAGNPISSSTVI